MDIIIQSLGFKSSEALENFVNEKIRAIKGDNIIRANVTLYKGPSSNPESDYCEIRLEVPGNDHFVKKHSQYFETSVAECADILNQMIRKAKTKNNERPQMKETITEGSFVSEADYDIDDVEN